MDGSPNLSRIPEGFLGTGDPIPTNPFEPESHAYGVWVEASRTAEESIARLNARLLDHDPAQLLSPEWREGQVTVMVVEKFNIWALRGIQVLWDDSAVRWFDGWLVSYGESWLAAVAGLNGGYVDPESLLPRLRVKLIARIEFWKAEARRYRAQQVRNDEINKRSPVDGRTRGSSAVPDDGRESLSAVSVVRRAGELGAELSDAQLSEHRKRMLEEYKARAGNPSNRRIYEASNSGIHKPEFYDWRKGILRPSSQTCINFERFLKEGKPPKRAV